MLVSKRLTHALPEHRVGGLLAAPAPPYLSECLQHLRGLVVFPLLCHRHHLLDHADAPLIWRWRPAPTELVP